jgi:hypothetical protein
MDWGHGGAGGALRALLLACAALQGHGWGLPDQRAGCNVGWAARGGLSAPAVTAHGRARACALLSRAARLPQVGSTQLMDATDGNHPKHTLIQSNIIREV